MMFGSGEGAWCVDGGCMIVSSSSGCCIVVENDMEICFSVSAAGVDAKAGEDAKTGEEGCLTAAISAVDY